MCETKYPEEKILFIFICSEVENAKKSFSSNKVKSVSFVVIYRVVSFDTTKRLMVFGLLVPRAFIGGKGFWTPGAESFYWRYTT